MIIEKPLADIELDDIQDLVDNDVPEGKELEYKEYLDLDNQKHKEQLVGEATSFANARGGDIFVGIPEDNGTPEKVAGFPVNNIDATTDRWANTIRRGADPKLPPSLVDIEALHVQDDRYVFIVRVNKSWNPPHRVRDNDKFYGRGASGKFDLETAEIRRRILETERLTDQIDNFRNRQISEFRANDTPLPVPDTPKLLLHLIPASAFSPGKNIDRRTASTLSKVRPRTLYPDRGRGGSSPFENYTVDSVIVHHGVHDAGVLDWVRTFQNGCIEMYTTYPFPNVSENNMIDTSWVKTALRDTLPYQLNYFERQGVRPPVYAAISLVNAAGFAVDTSALVRHHPLTFDAVERLPEVLIETYDVEVDEVVDDLIDYLYNAGGLQGPNSPMYENE